MNTERKRRMSFLLLIGLLLMCILPVPAAAGECPAPDSERNKGNHFWNLTGSTNPSCTSPGTETYQCTYCGQTKTEQTSGPLDHDWSDWGTQNATCTSNGIRQRSCRRCGQVEQETLPATGHSWGGWQVTRAATCASAGEQVPTCSVCGATETASIPATGNHSWGGWQVIRAATCTSEGARTRTCSVCGTSQNDSVARLPHSYGGWRTTREATCTAEGEEAHSCSVCGHQETRSTARLPHNYGDWKVSKEPTCTETGTRSHTCRDCGQEETQTMEMLPHSFTEWDISVPATDHSCGQRSRKCSVCGLEENEEFDPEGTLRRGDVGDPVKEMQQLLIDQDYLNEGSADGKFGPGTESAVKKYQEDHDLTSDGVGWPQTIEHLRHEYGEWVIVTEMTPFSVGLRERTCTKCGFKQQEEFAPAGILKRGDVGDGVTRLQEALNAAGHECGTADGKFGGKTETAVKVVEEELGVEQDGIAWPGVQTALFKLPGAPKPDAELSVAVKSVTPDQMYYGAGETIHFELELTNNGEEDLTSWTIYQMVDNKSIDKSWTGIAGGETIGSGESVTWDAEYTITKEDVEAQKITLSWYATAFLEGGRMAYAPEASRNILAAPDAAGKGGESSGELELIVNPDHFLESSAYKAGDILQFHAYMRNRTGEDVLGGRIEMRVHGHAIGGSLVSGFADGSDSIEVPCEYTLEEEDIANGVVELDFSGYGTVASLEEAIQTEHVELTYEFTERRGLDLTAAPIPSAPYKVGDEITVQAKLHNYLTDAELNLISLESARPEDVISDEAWMHAPIAPGSANDFTVTLKVREGSSKDWGYAALFAQAENTKTGEMEYRSLYLIYGIQQEGPSILIIQEDTTGMGGRHGSVIPVRVTLMNNGTTDLKVTDYAGSGCGGALMTWDYHDLPAKCYENFPAGASCTFTHYICVDSDDVAYARKNEDIFTRLLEVYAENPESGEEVFSQSEFGLWLMPDEMEENTDEEEGKPSILLTEGDNAGLSGKTHEVVYVKMTVKNDGSSNLELTDEPLATLDADGNETYEGYIFPAEAYGTLEPGDTFDFEAAIKISKDDAQKGTAFRTFVIYAMDTETGEEVSSSLDISIPAEQGEIYELMLSIAPDEEVKPVYVPDETGSYGTITYSGTVYNTGDKDIEIRGLSAYMYPDTEASFVAADFGGPVLLKPDDAYPVTASIPMTTANVPPYDPGIITQELIVLGYEPGTENPVGGSNLVAFYYKVEDAAAETEEVPTEVEEVPTEVEEVPTEVEETEDEMTEAPETDEYHWTPPTEAEETEEAETQVEDTEGEMTETLETEGEQTEAEGTEAEETETEAEGPQTEAEGPQTEAEETEAEGPQTEAEETESGKDEYFWTPPTETENTVTETEETTGGKNGGDGEDGPHGVITDITVWKEELSYPGNGLFYTEGETISYAIHVKNTGETPIDEVVVCDTLKVEGGDEVGSEMYLMPESQRDYFYDYVVTGPDADAGKVINQAYITWTMSDNISHLLYSDPVVSATGKETPEETEKETTGETEKETTGETEKETTGETEKETTGETEKETTGETEKETTGETEQTDTGKDSLTAPGLQPPTFPAQPETLPAQTNDYCRPVLAGAGEGVRSNDLFHCAEHAETSKKVSELLANAQQEGTQEALTDAWKQTCELWTEAVNKEYDEWQQRAAEVEKPFLVKERALFFEQLICYQDELTGLAPEDPVLPWRTIAELLRKQCVFLCYESHTVPVERLDSMVCGSYEQLTAEEEPETCDIISIDIDTDVHTRETMCETHKAVDQVITTMLDELKTEENVTTQDYADVWKQAKQLWLTELDAAVNERYLASEEETQKVIAASRIAFGNWLRARENWLKVIYPGRMDIVDEVLTQTISERALQQCGQGKDVTQQ